MVFLFPGVIARKSFFSGPFKNRYENGSIIDKVAWNILCSIICLTLSSIVFGIIFWITKQFQVIDYKTTDIVVRYKDLYCIFESLSKNELPAEFIDYSSFIKYLVYLISIYTLSFVFGRTFFNFITRNSLERKFPFLQFRNHWEYLAVPNVYNFSKIDYKRNYETYVDIMTGDKDNKELFRGVVNKIVYDKDNKMEHILLTKTIQFIKLNFDKEGGYESDKDNKLIIVNNKQIREETIHVLSKSYVVYKKVIDGDIFVIPSTNIKNLNFTYMETIDEITEVSPSKVKQSKTDKSLSWDFTLSIVFCVLSLYYSYYNVNLNFLYNYLIVDIIIRILIGSYIIFFALLFLSAMKNTFDKTKSNYDRASNIEVLVVLTIPAFSIIYDLPFIYTITIFFVYSFVTKLVWLALSIFFKNKLFIFSVKFISGILLLIASINYILNFLE